MKRVLGNVVSLRDGGFDGAFIREALDAIDPPMSRAKSEAMFEEVLAKLDKQAHRDARLARVAQAASAIFGALTSASAYRLLSR